MKRIMDKREDLTVHREIQMAPKIVKKILHSLYEKCLLSYTEITFSQICFLKIKLANSGLSKDLSGLTEKQPV